MLTPEHPTNPKKRYESLALQTKNRTKHNKQCLRLLQINHNALLKIATDHMTRKKRGILSQTNTSLTELPKSPDVNDVKFIQKLQVSVLVFCIDDQVINIAFDMIKSLK